MSQHNLQLVLFYYNQFTLGAEAIYFPNYFHIAYTSAQFEFIAELCMGVVFWWYLKKSALSLSIILFLHRMHSVKQFGEEPVLSMKTITWHKNSHSLFDYQSNKNVTQNTVQFSLSPKYIYIYRNNTSHQISFRESDEMEYKISPNCQFLGCVQLKEDGKKTKMDFYNATEVIAKNGSETARTNSSNSPIQKKDEDIYLIVRSLKNKNNQNKGYKLKSGQVIKLGRIEYLITSASETEFSTENKTKFWANNKKIVVEEPTDIDISRVECKYCYMGQTEELGGFLCSPCKCSGSCAMVHFKCLEKWNQSKVKKELIGSTIQYNFQKFYCEVCKDEYPRYIEKKNVQYELLPIEKPTGQHIMLEGISEKANNMMVIQEVPQDGIKLGRGHECEIRITDISVSRNHAKIEKVGNEYYLFDNKSKFGTLVREHRLSLELSRIKQGIQIGRTVITLELTKRA